MSRLQRLRATAVAAARHLLPQLNISQLAMQLGTVVHHALNQLLFIHHCKLGLALSQQVRKG